MPKFKVKKGYAYYMGGDTKSKLTAVAADGEVELTDINEGEQSWKLELVSEKEIEKPKSEDTSKKKSKKKKSNKDEGAE